MMSTGKLDDNWMIIGWFHYDSAFSGERFFARASQRICPTSWPTSVGRDCDDRKFCVWPKLFHLSMVGLREWRDPCLVVTVPMINKCVGFEQSVGGEIHHTMSK